MIESKPSAIKEAPSLADITSAEDRVGKVDFTAKLGDRTSETDEAARAADQVVSLTSMVRPQRPAGETTTDSDDGPNLPFILPPAKVDAAMTAEAERTKAEIAAARGEVPDDEDDVDVEVDADLDDDGADAAADTTDTTGVDTDDTNTEDTDVEARTGPPVGLVISEVADLDTVAAAVAQLEAEEASRADAEEITRLEAETADAARSAERALALAAAIDAASFDDDEPLTGPDDAHLHSVREVAATVIAAMRRINEVHERHVESIELETARRCELLTAQAELDAELIRLHARREAHAIISAARTRSGEHDAEVVETDQLGEIGETFSRFAETIETAVAPSPESPDHLRKS